MTSESDQKGYRYQRIVRAKLFVDTHFSESIGVRKIAAEAFLSRYHFIRLFKRRVGHTPSAYQYRQHEIRADIARNPLKFVPTCFAEKQGWVEKSNFEEPSG